jgi:periplasmic protein TonB
VIALLAALAAAGTPPDPPAIPARVISGTITELDYPPAALARGAEGLTKVWMVITADGRATDCRLFQSSGHADLDSIVCPLATRRMRFSPALDGKGKPRPMNAVMPVRWMVNP